MVLIASTLYVCRVCWVFGHSVDFGTNRLEKFGRGQREIEQSKQRSDARDQKTAAPSPLPILGGDPPPLKLWQLSEGVSPPAHLEGLEEDMIRQPLLVCWQQNGVVKRTSAIPVA